MNKEFFFVINPIAAAGKTAQIWPQIRNILESEKVSFDYCFSSYKTHSIEIATYAIKHGYKKIIAVGGDGTLNEVLNGFWEKNHKINQDTALGYFPCGTGEDFARTLAVEKLSIENQTRRLLKADVTKIDICQVHYQKGDGSFDKRRFINESSVGFGANVAETVNRSLKIFGGKTSFLLGVLRCLVFLKNHNLKITADGKEIFNNKTLIVVVANGKYFGGNMLVSPKSIIDDGFLEIIIVKEMNRKEVLENIGSIYSGNHLLNPKVLTFRCKEVFLQSNEKVFLETDGEPIGLLDAHIELLPKEIKFLL